MHLAPSVATSNALKSPNQLYTFEDQAIVEAVFGEANKVELGGGHV